MTTIVGVMKNGSIALASDSLTSEGELAIPGDMKLASPKIVRLGRAYVGLAGSVAHQRVLHSVYSQNSELFDFSSADAIFDSFRAVHTILKDRYFLMPSEDDDDQEYESNQLQGLICSPHGLFSIQSYREVTQFSRFWACGSGTDYALGALEATYASNQSALALARSAVKIACRFDKSSELPLDSHRMKLATR